MEKFKTIVKVKWVDAHPINEWIEKKDVEDLLKDDKWKSQESVGYYCCENKDVFVMAQDTSKELVNSLAIIPKKMIISIKEIKEDL
jgi:hypothetical protein